METFFRLVYPLATFLALPCVVIAAFFVQRALRSRMYRYSLAGALAHAGNLSQHPYRFVLWCMRLVTLLVLAVLLGKPQRVDSSSKVQVDGLDIMLVLDVSGSMEMQDYEGDSRSRFAIAKEEAVKFIEKRNNDAIGLVLFGQFALARCPVTHDKTMLKKILSELELGFVNPGGTVLAASIITAANRLKQSKATSKVMILLTDGEPSDGDDKPELAIKVAKALGIKIYTIGVGSDQERFMRHPFYGLVPVPRVNTTLLQKVADETGGKFFHAERAQELGEIYNAIDQLEKSSYDTPVFTRHYDIFEPFIWFLLALLLLEVLLTTWWWLSLC